ncbi:MAG: hypothetical protein ACO3JL_14375 [Myxococcota bacterium]
MTHLVRIFAVIATVALSPSCALFAAAEESGCGGNADCSGGRLCASTGECVECLSESDCGADEFCCLGGCLPMADAEQHCGCPEAPRATSSEGNAGEACMGQTNICLVDGEPATRENLALGECGCSCSASLGGALCGLDDARELLCGCDRSDPGNTCERPALDPEGNPHIVADTCTPQEVCVCFAAGLLPCDAAGSTPDCTGDGCVNALGDTDNCGVAGRICDRESTGIEGTGTCLRGGCSCNSPSDCQGEGLNVDLCAVLTSGNQCVCDDYEAGGEKAACPLGLECVTGGCSFGGQTYSTRASLLEVLGVPAP